MAIKYAMKKKKMAKGGGVHKGEHGTSEAGESVRKAAHANGDGSRFQLSKEDHLKMAKDKHHDVLREMTAMSGKNRKYLADGGSVDKVSSSMKSAFGTPAPKMAEQPKPAKQYKSQETPLSRAMKNAFRGDEAMASEKEAYADGGEVHSHKPRTTKKMWQDYEHEKNMKGIHKNKFAPSAGLSSAGTHARVGDNNLAKKEHKKVLDEMKDMKTGYFSDGGKVEACMHGSTSCDMCHATPMWEGGQPEDYDEYEEHLTGKTPEENEKIRKYRAEKEAEDMDIDNEHDEGVDMVGKIMRKRFSKGGRVANDVGDGASADLKENQFDDLVLDDDLDSSYTGEDSGDELGNEQEDEDRRDIVSAIMKSRKKKDRMPSPA